ncbi:arsenic resistance protein [Entomohabitans teleogrylli]|uniref:arsenic resistance protein n=1 Tax=Entomohabitans teleogrylli TaxID=1384589 RepID=UPI00073D1A92|nr:bile acid:sodium symporter [Entomohabitans teleogrylli]
MNKLRAALELHQVVIYFACVVSAALVAGIIRDASGLEWAVNPALALMLFVTFLQVPVTEVRQALTRMRFLFALLATNFIAIPLLAAALVSVIPLDPLLRFGVLLVLLMPCIDYVVTFTHLGCGDARLMLAATPLLLVAQMALLPVYLRVFIGDTAAHLIHPGPFIDAFLWLIATPFLLAALVQLWASRHRSGARVAAVFGLLPVPATALVLFIVVMAMVPQLGAAPGMALWVIPCYLIFAVAAPLVGWSAARLFRLETGAARALAFSASTRNSLVVLPLALAIPGTAPLLPAIIVTQTLVELVSELIYLRVIPLLIRER